MDQTKQWGINQELSTRISKVHKIKHNGSKTKINKLKNMETINTRNQLTEIPTNTLNKYL